MKPFALALVCFAFITAMVVGAGEAQARRPCPPGYFWDGPYGCMPYAPPPPPPPPVYYPYYRPVYPQPCPPGTFWDYNVCRPVSPPPPPPRYGITIDVPPLIIR
jgi:hypothetical protein